MSRDDDENAALDACIDDCEGSGVEFIGRQVDSAMSDVFWNRGLSENTITVPKGTELGRGQTAAGYEWVEVSPGIIRRVKRVE
jgi:hypothetical protein